MSSWLLGTDCERLVLAGSKSETYFMKVFTVCLQWKHTNEFHFQHKCYSNEVKLRLRILIITPCHLNIQNSEFTQLAIKVVLQIIIVWNRFCWYKGVCAEAGTVKQIPGVVCDECLLWPTQLLGISINMHTPFIWFTLLFKVKLIGISLNMHTLFIWFKSLLKVNLSVNFHCEHCNMRHKVQICL